MTVPPPTLRSRAAESARLARNSAGGEGPVSLAACQTDQVELEDVSLALAEHGYLADDGLATAVFLALELHRPLLLEGEAGVGKTEVAKVLARWTGAPS